jgi:hypothetical protein
MSTVSLSFIAMRRKASRTSCLDGTQRRRLRRR